MSERSCPAPAFRYTKLAAKLLSRVLIPGSFFFTFVFGGIWIAGLTSGREYEEFRITALVLCFVALASLLAFSATQIALRKRTIDGTIYTLPLYALITAELRARGVTSTRRFIKENADYVKCFNEVSEWIYVNGTTAQWDNLYALRSLIYSAESDPERTRNTLLDILSNRGISDPQEARDLIKTMMNAENAVMSGAL